VRLQGSRRPGPIRTRYALAASALAHALALLLLSLLQDGRPRPPAPATPHLDRVVSVELRAGSTTTEEGLAPDVSSAGAKPPTTSVRRGPPAGTGASLLRMRARPSLPTPRELALAIVSRAGPETAAQEGDDRTPEPMADQLDRYFRERQARANAAAGRVHPQVQDVLRAARARFDGQRARVAAAGETMGRDQRTFLRTYRAEVFRRIEAELRGEAPNAGRKNAPQLLAWHNRLRTAARARADRLTTTVCVVLAAGKPPVVTLAISSGSLTFDRAALESLPPQFPHQLAPDAPPGRVCYRFTGIYFAAPIIPGIFCEPAPGGPPRCALPGKPVVELEVAVESVE
jgi:hypothetical protein